MNPARDPKQSFLKSQEAPKRLPGGSPEAPRKLPRGSQEAPRRLPGGSHGNQGSKRHLRQGRVIWYWFLQPFLQGSYLS